MIQIKAGAWFVLLGLLISIQRADCGAAAAGIGVALRVLEQSRNFTTVLSLLRGTGIDLALGALNQVTFMAPSDAAFRLLPDGELGTLDRDDILNLLRLHAVPSYLPIAALGSKASFQSFSGEPISFSRPSRSSVVVRCGRMDGADVVSIVVDQFPAVVYSIDRVLLPPSLQDSAPSGKFAPAGAPFFSPAPAPATTPVPSISPAPVPAGLPRHNSSFLDVLENVSGFSTLASLIVAMEINKKLESLPALTYLAPTDQAFTSLSKPALRKLTDSQLAALLEFHGIPRFFEEFNHVVNPLATLATYTNGSFNRGKYLLHIQQRVVNDSIEETIAYTGVDQTKIAGPLFIHSPRLAVYAVEKLLLPLELSWLSASNVNSPAPAHPPVPAEESQAQTKHSVLQLLTMCLIAAAIAM